MSFLCGSGIQVELGDTIGDRVGKTQLFGRLITPSGSADGVRLTVIPREHLGSCCQQGQKEELCPDRSSAGDEGGRGQAGRTLWKGGLGEEVGVGNWCEGV